MDLIYIEDLRVETVIGIYDWEREIKQTITINLEMATDVARAAATDCIDDALDYKAISKRLITYVENEKFGLVETLAEGIAKVVQQEFGVPWLRLRLGKPGALRGSRDVGVVIERGQRS